MRTFSSLILLFLLHPFLSDQHWLTDLSKAKEMATQKDLPIVLVFQGSDWCAPCIKLDREIWSQAEFITYADDHFVMLKADFPRKSKNQLSDAQTKKNERLAETYNPEGIFPLVVVLDKNGRVLGKTGYIKTNPETYIENLESFLQ